MQETAFAKINLALHVRAREPDGYHRIETLFAFAEDGDRLSAEPGDDLTLSVEGPFAGAIAGNEDNLVLRAARALKERFEVAAGAALRLRKILPVAAGLGGGSADAGAALRLLTRLWALPATPDDLDAIAADLGADVPACLLSATSRGEGRGDRLAAVSVPEVEGLPLLLVNPGVEVPTPHVFGGWSGVDRGALGRDYSISGLAAARNDLEEPAVAVAPAIAELLDALRSTGSPLLVRMSGSGATCFALYADAAARDEAGAMVRQRYPDWWQLASKVRP
jgi:4-diphosphocytidyl-2-C-methyl-D-erythritol kinase